MLLSNVPPVLSNLRSLLWPFSASAASQVLNTRSLELEPRFTSLAGSSFVLVCEEKDPRPSNAQAFKQPLTILNVKPGDTITVERLKSFVDGGIETDDVFSTHFLREVLFCGAGEDEVKIEPHALEYLKKQGATSIDFVEQIASPKGPCPRGPFVSFDGWLWRPWKLYPDFNNAFMLSLRPFSHTANLNNRSYKVLDAVSSAAQALQVAVPSRLAAEPPSANRPLEGLRIAVKDCYDVRGTKTTLCNRAYHDLYPPVEETAEAVQLLIDAGAVLIGKTKLGSFISKEDPAEAIDYSAPFNPRGDGYQNPVASSTGSASAITSYDWLDVTIGSDTNGSGRQPAFVQGCFGLRPTKDLIPSKGLVPSFERFDVPYIFSRELRHISQLATFYQDHQSDKQKSTSKPIDLLIYPLDWLPTSSEIQMKTINAFVEELEAHLGVQRKEISIAKAWEASPPPEAEGASLHSYLERSGWVPVFYDNFHNMDQFRNDYEEKFQKYPYVNPYIRWKWGVGSEITIDEREVEMKKLNIYKDWLLKEVFQTETHNGILILPIQEPAPNYRDAPPAPPAKRNGDLPMNISPILGAPELTIPLTEYTYNSIVSRREERLPLGVSIVGTPGADTVLIEAIGATLKEVGRPLKVSTGSRAFPD